MYDFLVGLCFGVCGMLYMPDFIENKDTKFIESINFIISTCENELPRNIKCKIVGVPVVKKGTKE